MSVLFKPPEIVVQKTKKKKKVSILDFKLRRIDAVYSQAVDNMPQYISFAFIVQKQHI